MVKNNAFQNRKKMAVYEVFSCPVLYKYKTSVCSKATFVMIFTALVTYISPLLLAYRSYGFWLRADTYIEQPMVRFKHQYLLLAETNIVDAPILCSTFDKLNQQLIKNDRCSLVKVRELDENKDGKVDEIEFEIEIQLYDSEEMFALKLVLLFDYRLSVLCHLQMEGAAFIQHVSALPGSSFDVIADLKLVQKNPLNYLRGVDLRFNHSVVGGSRDLQNYHLPTIFKHYTKRNVTTRLHNEYFLWRTGRVQAEPFMFKANLHIPEQTIVYKPGFWQVMKWAWLQYFALLVLVKAGTETLKHWIFSQHVVPVIKMSPPWTKHF